MRDFHLHAFPKAGTVNFLDATDEEIADLVRSLVDQLAIMSSCLAMPAEQRKALRTNIARYEAYLNCMHRRC
jgi:hypothetical protein